MTSSITKFDTSHEDLIQDISYDFYGKRLVTCSADQKLKVWDFVEKPDASYWELNDTWKAHDASILKAIWARPEYGSVIVSCSFDRQVKIWEEQTVEPRNSQKRWAERFRLVESKSAVVDIAFSPSLNSLKIATCSSEGIVRIYEALEPTNLAQWSQMEEFEIHHHLGNNNLDSDGAKKSPSGIALLQQQQSSYTQQPQQLSQSLLQQQLYLQSQQQPAAQTPQAVTQYGFHQPGTTPQTQAYPLATAPHGFAIQSGSTQSMGSSISSTHAFSASGDSHGSAQGVSPIASHHKPIDVDGNYCIDWCPNRPATAMMVVGLGREIGARIFKHDGNNKWIPSEILPGHTQEVHDVSWAPSMARSYQLIATACKDGIVRIFKLTEQPSQQTARGRTINSPAGTPTQLNSLTKSYQIELIASLNDHKAEVWKVEWNITGTILSSSGDDGKIRLWTTGYDGKWRQMASINTNTP